VAHTTLLRRGRNDTNVADPSQFPFQRRQTRCIDAIVIRQQDLHMVTVSSDSFCRKPQAHSFSRKP
jgi:hypothetical protein